MEKVDSSNTETTAVFAPLIRSERLTMTLYEKERDAQFLGELLFTTSEPLPGTPVLSPEAIDRRLRNKILSSATCQGMDAPGPATYIVHLGDESGPKIGKIQLSERSPALPPDLGYGIHPTYHRQGYATEAARAVLNYWRYEFGLKSIAGFCSPTNIPSNAVLVKIGFEPAGNALMNESTLVNAYVLPGMDHFTVENCRFNRPGVEEG